MLLGSLICAKFRPVISPNATTFPPLMVAFVSAAYHISMSGSNLGVQSDIGGHRRLVCSPRRKVPTLAPAVEAVVARSRADGYDKRAAA